MKKVSFDELIKQIPNKYELTIVVGKRVREIGAHNIINSKAGRKETTIQKCFKEIRDGLVVVSTTEADELALAQLQAEGLENEVNQ